MVNQPKTGTPGMSAKSAALPAKPEAAKAPKPDEKLINPLDIGTRANEGSDLIKSIVSTETSKEEKPILGAAPEVDLSLLKEIAPQKSLLLVILKAMFGLLLVSGAASYLFFTSQLTNTLDFAAATFDIPNISQELSSANAEIIILQTDLNLNRYLQIKAHLDKFSFDGDSYVHYYEISNSQTASSSEKKLAADEMEKLKSSLRESFMSIRALFAENFTATLIDAELSNQTVLDKLFQEKLASKLGEKAASIEVSADPQAIRDYKNYIQSINLVANDKLHKLFIDIDFDALPDIELYDLIKQINVLIVNDLSIIQEIKSQRVKWSDIINEIELRTIAVDTHYSEDLFEALGGIRYTSYDFDTEGRRISVIGETKSIDTTNFTVIADLIDSLNQSEFFEDAEMRSFSKSGSFDEGYTASLNLSFNLQGEEIAEQDEVVDVDEIPGFLGKTL